MSPRSLAGTAALLATLALTACGAQSQSQSTASSTSGPAASVPANSPSTTANIVASAPTAPVVPTTVQPHAHTGGTVVIPSGGFGPPAQVTLLSFVDPASGADQFAVPVAGDRFVGVRLRVTFGGTSPVQENLAGDTSIQDSQGSTYSSTQANLQGCPAFTTGLTLSPGKTATGCVTFDVSAATTITEVMFTPGGQLGNVTAEWDIP